MGLSVGVVKITYLDEPSEQARGFLDDLKIQALEGLEEPDEDDDDEWAWGGGWGRNGIVEFSRNYLGKRLAKWVDGRSVGPSEGDAVQAWIDGLPWENNLIMLHLGE